MPLTEAMRFERCLDEVLKHEGGYVDHKATLFTTCSS